MKVLISGTAGAGGWPAPDCGCASCARVTPGRRPTSVVLDVSVAPDGPLVPDGPVAFGGSVRLPLSGPLPPGYRASPGPDGLTVTTPGGRRVLHAASSPSYPYDESSYGESSYDERDGQVEGADDVEEALDLVLLDVLDRPERLGDLRRRGLVGERTHVVTVDVDHRVPTEAELTRRAALWGVRVVPDGTVVDTSEPPPAQAPPPRRTLLLGGSRSGKSAEAELRLAAEPEVLYVATGPSGDGDPEWLRRVRAHRDRRPAHWRTAETTDLAGLLRSADTPLLIDGLGTWVAAVFDECDAWPEETGEGGRDDRDSGDSGDSGDNKNGEGGRDGRDGRDTVAARCDDLVAAWRQTRARVVAVSDEVGLGVVPGTASGRMFRDTLGRLNQRLALESEDVTLVVAGRLLPLPI
ncbi:bifunctional adenosylcobinamide kinase/adenosylcobinamide-phosphate guanylyltransferase [Streptosporangium sp. NBC_01469]|uniref:bifunctional adenosylcobinamide kinase/adenosylcobinamide-phosphate guanylyltransferase n=1 Tax=Streptosporangium sp. NBC_01469 TaxID=2903898 RepID=UPI002E2A440A|nr:bifunctional adenosylcobinamide kinase/adenosylcobinamide-phosphate guanylyltransferase [Streptosporangium sp. NBC_01469]